MDLNRALPAVKRLLEFQSGGCDELLFIGVDPDFAEELPPLTDSGQLWLRACIAEPRSWRLCWFEGPLLERLSGVELRLEIVRLLQTATSCVELFPVFSAEEPSDWVHRQLRDLRRHFPRLVSDRYYRQNENLGLACVRG